MTKQELIKYIETLKNNRVNELLNEMNKEQEELRQFYYNFVGIDDDLKLVRKNLKQSHALIKRINSNIGLPEYKWQSQMTDKLERLIEDITIPGSYVPKYFETREIRGVSDIDNRYKPAIQATTEEYIKLLTNLRALKTAKEGINYLEDLGFTVPSDEEIKDALMVPIDISKLGLKDE